MEVNSFALACALVTKQGNLLPLGLWSFSHFIRVPLNSLNAFAAAAALFQDSHGSFGDADEILAHLSEVLVVGSTLGKRLVGLIIPCDARAVAFLVIFFLLFAVSVFIVGVTDLAVFIRSVVNYWLHFRLVFLLVHGAVPLNAMLSEFAVQDHAVGSLEGVDLVAVKMCL